MARRLRVFLDANVLVDAQVRDLFLRMAEAELIDVRWSSEILEETSRVLTTRLGIEPRGVERLLTVMTAAFPEASVGGFWHLIDQLDLPDPDDRHVLAAAINGECDLLVTNNLQDFPDATVDRHDLLALSIDDAVLWLAQVFRSQLVEVVERQLGALQRNPISREAFLKRLAVVAPRGAAAVGAAIGDETFSRLLVDMADADRDDGPQSAVRSILELAEGRGDVGSLLDVIDEACARELTGLTSPTADELRRSLRERLDDVLSTPQGWGFATAKRPLSPGIEYVKLVRSGDEPLIASEPRSAPGHLFLLEHRGTRWVLLELDGADPAMEESGASVG